MAGHLDKKDTSEPAGAGAGGQTTSAADVFENYLGLGPFFTRHKDHILDKLEECDQIAEEAQRNQDMIFFAESFPFIDGLIQIGTTRQEYQSALMKVTEEVRQWGSKVDPANVISALTFKYIVDWGEKSAEKGNQRDRETWQRIKKRVHKLADDSDSDTKS